MSVLDRSRLAAIEEGSSGAIAAALFARLSPVEQAESVLELRLRLTGDIGVATGSTVTGSSTTGGGEDAGGNLVRGCACEGM